MRIIYNVKHHYAVHFIFGDKFLTSLSKLVLEVLHKKWSFPLRVSSVYVTKSSVFYLVTFTEEMLNGKLYFLCSEAKANMIVILP